MSFKTTEGEVITLKTKYELADKIETLYTGGKIDFTSDGEHVILTCGSSVKVIHRQTGRVTWHLNEDEDTITSFAVSPDGKLLLIGLRSQLIKQYDWLNKKLIKLWKAHISPIMAMTFDPSSTLLATGSADSSVKIWDCTRNYYTHNFHGSNGVVHLVQFHPKGLQLITSSSDCKIRLWDLLSSRCLHVLDSHMSLVTGVAVFADETTMISVGRDKIIIIWNIKEGKSQKTIPVFESLEGVALIPDDSSCHVEGRDNMTLVLTAGEKGVIKLWDLTNWRCVKEFGSITVGAGQGEHPEENLQSGYTQLLYHHHLKSIVGVTFDHNIMVYGLPEMEVEKQLIGYNDEILDIVLVGVNNSLVAVATNSEQARIFDRHTLNCQFLSGHTDIILSMDCSIDGKMLATSSKDNTIRLWSLCNSSDSFRCIAIGSGHTHCVGTVAFSRHRTSFLVSGSKDCTIKLWSLKSLSINSLDEDDVCVRLPVKYTQVAHSKDINSLDVSPNDKLIVSGSQDGTAKLWRVEGGALVGTLRGHRRAVWCVKFSPFDQCVATGSGDGTIKLWAIADNSCIKSFEGHTSSVLKVMFISRGMQLASSGGDGLVKIWSIKTTECVATLDEHTGKVWTVTGDTNGDLLISGGADSLICFWQDITERTQQEEISTQQHFLLREQGLSNLLHHKEYSKAVAMATDLRQPMRVFRILSEMLDDEGINGEFSYAIASLTPDQSESLLMYINQWNTNGKLSRTAQATLSVILRYHPPSELLKYTNLNLTVQGLIPYTERHFERLSKLQQLSSFVEYTCECMKLPTVSLSPSDRVLGKRALSARPMESSEFTITAKGELYPSDNSKGSSVMGMSAASTDSTSTNFHQVKSCGEEDIILSTRKPFKRKKLSHLKVYSATRKLKKLKRTPLKKSSYRLSLQ
ncbi:transducin beta-like protein 3 isoform X2 [Dysidea avara]|uniref:transducin beta-like protein 3 isoform X2 n=1 Tax=Dysidea avara TaxID=196820 RepID=UPI003318F15F